MQIDVYRLYCKIAEKRQIINKLANHYTFVQSFKKLADSREQKNDGGEIEMVFAFAAFDWHRTEH
jgi:hypothetical protein